MNTYIEIKENIYQTSINRKSKCNDCDDSSNKEASKHHNECNIRNGSAQECCDSCCKLPNCQNRMFQLKQYLNINLGPTSSKGHGVFAGEAIKKGQFIIEYIGVVINHAQLLKSIKKYTAERREHKYIMALNELFIDATMKGNISRFMNHLCDPNCIAEVWDVGGLNRIGFFAKKAIKKGEELTYNYGSTFDG